MSTTTNSTEAQTFMVFATLRADTDFAAVLIDVHPDGTLGPSRLFVRQTARYRRADDDETGRPPWLSRRPRRRTSPSCWLATPTTCGC